MTVPELLQQIKERLQALYGERFKGLVLYGSEARGDAGPDSDVDVLCLLEGSASAFAEIRAITDAVYDLETAMVVEGNSDRMIHVMPADVERFESGATGFYRIVRREGRFL